jgi:hypothetical protein
MNFREKLLVCLAKFLGYLRLAFGIAVASVAAVLKFCGFINQQTRERIIAWALGEQLGGVGR